MRQAALVLAAFVPLACAGTSVAHAQAISPLLAADLGTHIEPIAQLAARGWVPLPRGGLGRLAPGEWTRWTARGGPTTIRLSVREPTGRCAAPRRMPVAGAAPASGGAGYIGIAVSGGVEIVPNRPVRAGSIDAARIAAAAAPLFAAREREHGVSGSTFSRVPVTLDSAFEAGAPAARAYYFEASKRVFDAGNTPEEDPRGIVRLTVSGWLRDSGTHLAPVGTKGELYWDPDDEDAPTPASLTPLGVVRDGTAQMWVMRERIGVRESILVYALESTVRPLLAVDAAQC